MTEAVVNNFIEDAVSGSTEQNKSYIESFLSQVSEFRENEFTCDVVIKISGKEIHAHKLVLAAGSPYFSMCFFGVLAGRQRIDVNEVKLDDLEFSAVDAIVQYCYSSKINITENTVKELFKAADFLQVEWVREKCAAYIKKILTISNCIDFWHFSESLCADLLSSDLVLFILQNLTEISTKPEFLALSDEKIKYIYTHDLRDKCSQSLFIAIMRWIEHDVKKRTIYLETILQYIPFVKMGKDFIRTQVKTNSLISSELKNITLLTEALCDEEMEEFTYDDIIMGEPKINSYNPDGIFILGTIHHPVKYAKIEGDQYQAIYSIAETKFLNYDPVLGCNGSMTPNRKCNTLGAAMAFSEDTLYFSGRDTSSSITCKTIVPGTDFRSYNTANDQWTTFNSTANAYCYHSMVINFKDYAYIMGPGMEIRSLSTGKSEQLIPRDDLKEVNSACIEDGIIYACTRNDLSANTVIKQFNITSCNLSKLIEIDGAFHCSIVAYDGQVYISSSSWDFLSILDKIQPKKLIQAMTLGFYPSAGHTTAVYDGDLYLFDKNFVIKFDRETKRWLKMRELDRTYDTIRVAIKEKNR